MKSVQIHLSQPKNLTLLCSHELKCNWFVIILINLHWIFWNSNKVMVKRNSVIVSYGILRQILFWKLSYLQLLFWWCAYNFAKMACCFLWHFSILYVAYNECAYKDLELSFLSFIHKMIFTYTFKVFCLPFWTFLCILLFHYWKYTKFIAILRQINYTLFV